MSLDEINSWPKSLWIALMAAVLCVHLVFLFGVSPKLSHKITPSYNQNSANDGYQELAENLVNGHGYRFDSDTAPTLMREPGYPLFLAALMLGAGTGITAIKLANVLMVIVTAWLVMRLARNISTKPVVVYGSPLLFLLHPGVVIAESRGAVESLFTLLIVLFLLTLYVARDEGRWWNYVLSGVVLGAAVSVRSVAMLFPLFWAIYLLLYERQRTSWVMIARNAVLLIVTMFAILLPWIVRNYRLTRKFVPTASVLGVSAHAGQYINTHLFNGKPFWLLDREAARERRHLATELGYPFEDDVYYQSFYRTEDELKFSKYLMGRVEEEYKRYPLLFLKSLTLNLFNFWFAGKTWASTGANMIVQLPYLVLAFLGIRVALRRYQWRAIAPLILFIAYTIAIYAPILAQARYSVPLIPFMSILATMALLRPHENVRSAEKEVSTYEVSLDDQLVTCGAPAGMSRREHR